MKKLILLSVLFAFLFQLGLVGQNALPASANASAGKPPATNACLECHQKVLEKKMAHKPVLEGCDKCHKSNGREHPKEEDTFELVMPVPQLCYSCHDEKNIMKAVVHAPLKEGDCLSCHDMHSSKNEHLLSVPPPGLCFSCHNDLKKKFESSPVQHGAVKEDKGCVNCHNPHSSGEKKLMQQKEPDLCFSCHDKKIAVGSRVIPNMKDLITRSKYVHGAIDNNGCAVCHNPHAGDVKNMLGKAYPAGNYAAATKDNYALCMDCHESTLFEDQTTTESTGFRNGDKNLHFVHVNKEKGRTCSNCHNIHASNKLFLLTDMSKFGQWNMPMRYTKLPK
ncbi:MAG TPA: cytochrome c3 family protein, partial [Bacteroidia bacterium]|nr:cytochrome c3 family protein [Bacteroidia bacterium]